MRIPLAAMFRRLRNPRRKIVALRQIVAPAIHASDLYLAAYKPIIALWEAALPDIEAEYARALATMTQDAPADVGVRISLTQTRADAVVLTLRTVLERWAARIEAWQRGKWRAAVLSATGVDLTTLIGPADARMTLEAAIERNASLVKSISDEARQRIADAVFRGLNERRPARDVAQDFREAIGMSRRRALNIASDQTVKITAALNEERRRQAGISAWEWIHSAKAHPRPVHVARNHNLYSDDPQQVGEQYQGKTVMQPPQDLPGQLPFCGCTTRAVLILN